VLGFQQLMDEILNQLIRYFVSRAIRLCVRLLNRKYSGLVVSSSVVILYKMFEITNSGINQIVAFIFLKDVLVISEDPRYLFEPETQNETTWGLVETL
jgi:hypothetical protein